jgi:hypothetical protein
MDMIGVLVDELGSQEAAARALGKSPTWLSKRKRVLSAPALAAAVERGEISLDHAYDVVTRSPDDETALAQLERVRAGNQNQGMTRGKLASRQYRSEQPPLLSDRNADNGQHSEASPRVDTISDRNHGGHGSVIPAPTTIPISGRNPMTKLETVANNGLTEESPIELETLATVRLVRDGDRHASRQAVLHALRTDLAMIEGQ